MTGATWHLITSEYPPRIGGVADHTHHLASLLAQAGDDPHVWCPSGPALQLSQAGVTVHREFGDFSRRDLARVDGLLDAYPRPRRLVVQWVPHGYGKWAMNLAFCLWVLRRSWHGDRVELMIHEPFLMFGEGSWKQDAAAAVQRLMLSTLLAAAHHVWVATPAWIDRARPWSISRSVPFSWLPIGSNIRNEPSPAHDQNWRSATGTVVIGHFGTHGSAVTAMIEGPLMEVLRERSNVDVLLLGANGDEVRHRWIRREPQWASRVHAAGALSETAVSAAIRACDLMVQPYPDGITCRRGSVMAALAHGIPVVSNRAHLTESCWDECQGVELVEDWSQPGAARAAMLRLLDCPDELARRGRAAQTFYDDVLDLRHAVAALRRESA